MKKIKNKYSNEFFYLATLRYFVLMILILINVFLIFMPFLTVKTIFYSINLFTEATLVENIISFGNHAIEIIPACVAISAYSFLLFLNLSVQMPYKKRFNSLLYGFTLLFLINILRILFFTYILTVSYSLFKTLHFLTWAFMSSIIVVLIWVSEIKLFKIKEIPVYTDIRAFIEVIKRKS